MTEQRTDPSVTELSASITVDADPGQLWTMLTDVTRMASWSDQVVKTVVFGGRVGLGTRFLNLNRQGWKHWPTTATVVRFAPHTDFAFRVVENRTVWSFQLEPTEDGATRVTHRRETPDGISGLSRTLIKAGLGGMDAFSVELQRGMETTVAKLKADAER